MPAVISRRTLLQAAALAASAAFLPARLLAAPVTGFTHSVASGDPGQTSVVLWTRYVGLAGASDLRVEIAKDAGFSSVASRGTASAGPLTDFCAHAQVDDLEPGRWYFYRFVAPDGEISPVGRTRTLPAGSLERFRIGVFSCANATSGWFNAYGHAAARNDLDLIVHLGDYIYESAIDRSDALEALAVERAIQPAGEAIQLADYRLRYASYRADRALMELHRHYPMIAMWDDHETANNAWKDGASNHDQGEGTWDARKTAGMRAFHEWLPVGLEPYRDYQIGDLATLFRLETRLLARSRQLDLEGALAGRSDLAAAVREFQVGPLASADRTMMGAAQEAWLAAGLARSVQAGTRWQVLAQQMIMAPTRLPDVSSDWFAPGTVLDEQQQRELATAGALSRMGLPLGFDRWDGYPAARGRLLDAATQADAELVVLSGDSHNAWAYDLAHRGQATGVELAVQSVSSLGLEKRFGGNPQAIASGFVDANSALQWCDTDRRGYMVLDMSPTSLTNEWLFLPSRSEQSLALLGAHQMTVERGARRLTV